MTVHHPHEPPGHRTPAGGTFWSAADQAQAEYPALSEDRSVDVVVVGGGIAGASVARELVSSGHSVALLERGRVGQGATGHSTGKVSVLQGDRFSRLEAMLGARATASYAESQLLAMHHLRGIVERLNIDCSLRKRPAYLFAETGDGLEGVQNELAAVRRTGLDLRFTLDSGLPFPTAGAARLEDQLELDPLAYVRGLVADLVAQGGTVHEETVVVGLEEGSPHRVVTSTGHRVRAHHVVVATQFPIFDRSLLFPRLHPHRMFVLAADLPEHAADLPGMYISCGPDIRSVRTTVRNGRRSLIITGAPFGPGDQDSPDRLRDLRGWADQRFGHPTWRCEWAGQDTDTPDLLPFIGPLHPFGHRVWVATGFGGWGLTNGVLAGILLRDLVEGREAAYASLFHTRRLAPVTEVRSLVRGSARMANNWVGSRIRAKVAKAEDISEVEPGASAYLTDDGLWAAYRDDDGGQHVVEAACSHQGCLVAFNDAETVWECPCHGSRFSVDGDVLQGPATAPLVTHPRLHRDSDATSPRP